MLCLAGRLPRNVKWQPRRSLRCLGWLNFAAEAERPSTRWPRPERKSFSSSKTVPEIRLRPATLHPEIVEDIPQENRVLLKAITSNLTEYRALVIVGRAFLVTSGANSVIMDRHPECPCKIVDAQMKAWRAEVRASAHASTRKHARQAATTGEETLEFLRRAVKAQEKRDVPGRSRPTNK